MLWPPDGQKRRCATSALETQHAPGCLYHRDLRTRHKARGTTWTHQPGSVRRVTRGPDRPSVKVPHVSARNRTTFLEVHPGDHLRTIDESTPMSNATQPGETGSSARGVPAPCNFFPNPFLSRPTLALPPFPPQLWRGALIVSYFAPSVTTGRISGPTASSSTRNQAWSQHPARPGRIQAALNSNRRTWDGRTQTLTVRGGKGEPDRQSGGQPGSWAPN